MDDLSNKTIKQFYFDTNDDTIIISCIIDKTRNFEEWWGHVKGYGTMVFLFGGCKVVKNRRYIDIASYCAYEYYDEIIDTKGD